MYSRIQKCKIEHKGIIHIKQWSGNPNSTFYCLRVIKGWKSSFKLLLFEGYNMVVTLAQHFNA